MAGWRANEMRDYETLKNTGVLSCARQCEARDLTEKDWEYLGKAEKDWEARQRDTRLQDHGTTR